MFCVEKEFRLRIKGRYAQTVSPCAVRRTGNQRLYYSVPNRKTGHSTKVKKGNVHDHAKVIKSYTAHGTRPASDALKRVTKARDLLKIGQQYFVFLRIGGVSHVHDPPPMDSEYVQRGVDQ